MAPETLVIIAATTLLVAYIGALGFAVTQIFRSRDMTQLEKWVWTIALIVFPVVTLVGWYLLDPRHSRDRHQSS